MKSTILDAAYQLVGDGTFESVQDALSWLLAPRRENSEVITDAE